MPNICHELIIEAPAEVVYNALTSQEGLSAWWTPQTTVNPANSSLLRFAFGTDYYKEMQITELKPFELVKWDCTKGGGSG